MCDFKNWTAFIPAAGYGTRMGDRCRKNQKCMLLVWEDKKPLLHYIIDNMKSVNCKNYVIAVNHCKNQIIDYFGDGSKFGVQINYVEGNFTSTYDTICDVLPFLPERFLYSHGDMIFQPYLYLELLEAYETNLQSSLSVMHNEGIARQMTHPQINISDGYVSEIHFGVKEKIAPYMYLGGAIYNKNDFIKTFDGDRSGMVEKVILPKLQNKEIINSVVYNGAWRHLMEEQDYQRMYNEKKWIVNES